MLAYLKFALFAICRCSEIAMLYQLHPTNSELEAFAMSASATYSGLIAAIVLLILPL